MTRNGTKSSGVQEDGRSCHRADHRSLHRGPSPSWTGTARISLPTVPVPRACSPGNTIPKTSSRCRSSTRARSWIAAVAENVVVELKAVDHLQPVHLAQVLTYLKLGGYPVNFNVAVLKRGLRRLAREI